MIDRQSLISVFGGNPHRFDDVGKKATELEEWRVLAEGFNLNIAVSISSALLKIMTELLGWIKNNQRMEKYDTEIGTRRFEGIVKYELHSALYDADAPSNISSFFCKQTGLAAQAQIYVLLYRNDDKKPIVSLEKFAGFLLFVLELYGRARSGSTEQDFELVDNYRLVKKGLIDLLAWIDMMY